MRTDKRFLPLGLLFAVIVYLPLQRALAQGIFLENGQNVLGLQGSFSRSADATGFSAALGYSLKGQLDFGISLGRVSAKNNQLENDLSAIAIAPSVAFHLLKQKKPSSLSVVVFGGYQRSFFSGNFDRHTDNIYSNSFPVGLSFYSSEPLSDRVNLYPIFSFSYIPTTTVLTYRQGGSEENSTNTTIAQLTLNCAVTDKLGSKFFISPGIAVSDIFSHNDERTFTFSLSVGYIMPRKK